jgi:hypothetical protein
MEIRMNKILLAAAALGAIAACNKEEPKKGPQTAQDVAKELSAMKMEPGQWEATNEVISASAPGVPEAALKQMIGQKTTVSNCVTPEQAARPSANFLAAQKDSDCTYQNFSMDDGRMTGTMTCSGGNVPGKMVMKMNGRYDPTSYDMNMEMDASAMPGGMTMTLKAKTTGRRVGDCAAGEAAK